MSSAGIWSRAPLRPSTARSMLASFAPATFVVREHEDAAAHVELAQATRDVSGHVDQPHPSGVAVLGDLRLDEADDLARKLGVAPGVHDARWLVAEAYSRWDVGFAAHLLGDFGFALWDARQRVLLVARDAGGARSMFYSTEGVRAAFASDPRAILSMSGVRHDLDERAVVDYLGELPQDESATLHAVVRRLPPGCVLVVKDTGARVVQYFDVTRTPERHLASDDDYAAALREALARAVEARAKGNVAVLLSGGLDSSSMTALARRALPFNAQLATLSAVFPGFPECDERVYQSAVVAAAGSRHREFRPDPSASAGDFGRLCRAFSEPSFIGPHWLAWNAAELAASDGVTTVLTGIDGDRVVSHGGGRFADLARDHDWWGLARELVDVADFTWLRRVRVFGSQAFFAALPKAAADAIDRLDPRRKKRFAAQRALLRPELLARQGLRDRLLRQPMRPRSSRDEHARSLSAPDRNWDVELLDQLGLTFGIRFEQPFFDRRVMELCFSFPGSQKRQAGWSRYVLRNAMRGLVPSTVLERRLDASFDGPYWDWARRWLTANPIANGSLSNLEPYVNVAEVTKMLANLPVRSDSGPVDFLWKCVVLSRWLQGPELPRAESFQPPLQLR